MYSPLNFALFYFIVIVDNLFIYRSCMDYTILQK